MTSELESQPTVPVEVDHPAPNQKSAAVDERQERVWHNLTSRIERDGLVPSFAPSLEVYAHGSFLRVGGDDSSHAPFLDSIENFYVITDFQL